MMLSIRRGLTWASTKAGFSAQPGPSPGAQEEESWPVRRLPRCGDLPQLDCTDKSTINPQKGKRGSQIS